MGFVKELEMEEGSMFRRILSLLLSICMMLTLLPAQAPAAEITEQPQSVPAPTETEEAVSATEQTELLIQQTVAQEAAAATEGTAGDTVTWTLSDDGILTISGSGAMADYGYFNPAPWKSSNSSVTKIVIEEGVTSIGVYAFTECRNLLEVTIPSTVKSIGQNAFNNCNALSSLALPEGLTSIGEYAFGYCNALTEVTVPGSVKELESRVFYFCQGLMTAVIGEGVTKLPDYMFYGCGKLEEVTISSTVKEIGKGVFNGAKLAAVSLPEGLTSIGDEAFSGNRYLTAVALPEGLQYLGSGAFNSCAKLTEIVIPAGVTEIGSSTFNYCTKLTSVMLSGDVTSIGDMAFHNCTSLKNINIPATVTAIGEDAFTYCSALKNITLPDGLTSIGARAFYNAGISGVVTIPDSVTYLGEAAFDWCQQITAVHIGSGITRIPKQAFHYCGKLENVTIPESVTAIGDEAFYSSALKEITIPASVETIDSGVFADCSDLAAIHVAAGNQNYASVDGVLFTADMTQLLQYPASKETASYTIPDTVTSIGDNTFYNCDNLTEVTIPGSVKSVGTSAFQYCGNLAVVTFGEGVEEIGYSAFSDTALTEAVLPDSLITLGEWSFSDCTALKTVSLGSALETFGSSAFSGCAALTEIAVAQDNGFFTSDGGVLLNKDKTALIQFPAGKTSYVIPDTVTSVPAYGFSGCSKLEAIVIPGSVKCLEDSVFSSCTALTDLTLGEGLETLGSMAFYGCTALESITVPASVTTIGTGTFSGCTGLKKIHFLGDAPSISSDAFGYSFSTSSQVSATAYYPGDNATWTEDKMQNYGGNLVWMVEGTVELVDMGTCGENLTWTLDAENKLTVSGTGAMYAYNSAAAVPWNAYRETVTEVVLEEGITTLDGYVFRDMANLTSVDLPSTLTSIGTEALANCFGLTSIVVPDAVTTIGDRAFYGCNNLTSVTLGSGLAAIGANAFYGTPWLEAQTDENGFTVIGGILVSYMGDDADVVVPETVRIIGAEAFSLKKRNITSISLPETVTALQSRAFYDLQNLTSVNIPSGVTVIPEEAFYRCGLLTTIVLPEGVTEIGNSAFRYCSELAEMTLPDTLKSIGEAAFQNCTCLNSLTLPEGFKEIGEDAFNNCRDLAELVLPQTLETIGDSAFQSCRSLTEVVIPDSVTAMDDGVFKYCSGLTGVTIGSGLRVLNASVFNGCSALAQVEIPINICIIEANAFYNCENLENLTFASASSASAKGGVEDDWEEEETYPAIGTALEIHNYAFGKCQGLTEVRLPNYLTYLSGTAFEGSLNTTFYRVNSAKYRNDDRGAVYEIFNGSSINLVCVPAKLSGAYTIADSVTKVEATFYGCSELTSLVFPTSVGGIKGNNAFFGCTKLVSVTAGPGNDDGYFNDEYGALLWQSGGKEYVCFLPANLTEYTLSAGTVSIYSSALSNVELERIDIHPENTSFSGLDGLLYNADCTELILYPGGRTDGRYFLPCEVAEIQDNAFANAEHLKQLWFTGEPFFFSPAVFAPAAESMDRQLMACYYPENVGSWADYVLELDYFLAGSVQWMPYVLLSTGTEELTVPQDKPVAIRPDADIGDLQDVLVDGKALDESEYEISLNGNMVLLSEQAQMELAYDDHTVTLRFAEGDEEVGTKDNNLSQEEFEEAIAQAAENGISYTLTSNLRLESDVTVDVQLNIDRGAVLTVCEGANVTLRDWLFVENGSIRVETGGKLTLCGGQMMEGTSLTLADGACMEVLCGEVYLYGLKEFRNEGTVLVQPDGYLINGSELVNDGNMVIRGVLVNEGSIVNNGEIAIGGGMENYGTISGNAPVEIEEPEYRVVITGSKTVLAGKSVLLKAAVEPAREDETKIIWSLADENDKRYVTLTNGRVTAKKVTEVHTVTVVAAAEDGSAEAGTFDVTVIPLATAVEISWETAIGSGEETTIFYDLNNEASGDLILWAHTLPQGAGGEVVWTWNDRKGAYADYTDNGDGSLKLEAKDKAGSVTITATTTDGSNKSAKVTVKFVKLAQEIEITNAKERIRGGDKLTLSTTVAADKTLTSRNVIWELIDDDEADSSAFATLNKGKLTTQVVSKPTLIKVKASVAENPEVSDTVSIWLHSAVDTVQILVNGEAVANNATVCADPDDGSVFLDAVFGPAGVIDEGTWTVSDRKGAYATFTEEADGSLTLTPTGKSGTVTVTLKAADGSGKNAKVKIKFDSLVDAFAISAASTVIRSGEKLQLTAVDETGAAVQGKFTWTSSDITVAAVSGSGKVTAKTVYGKTNVTITAVAKDGSGEMAAFELAVIPKSDETLGLLCDGANVTAKTVSVDADRVKTLDVKAAIYNALNDSYTDAGEAVLSSSNKKVADFAEGVLVIQGTGKTNITAKVGKKTVKFSLNAVRYADQVEITGKTDWLLAGKNQTLKVSLSNAAGKVTDKTVTWASSDESVATVSSKGKVTAQKIYRRETVTITASTANGLVVGEFALTVYPAATTVSVMDENGTVLNNRTVNAKVGDVLDLTAIVYPYEGEDGGAMQTVTWNISNKKAAAFNEEGKLELLKKGTVTVKVTTQDGSKKSVSFKINIAG